MKRKRFEKLAVGTLFLWDKAQKSLHVKIDDEDSIVLDNKSSYLKGTVTIMCENNLVEVYPQTKLFVHITDGGAIYLVDNDSFADAKIIIRLDSGAELLKCEIDIDSESNHEN